MFQKSDAKIQITATTQYLIRIKYPLSSFNYHLSDVNVQISTKSTTQFLSNSCFKIGTQKQKFPIWKIPISRKRQVSAERLLRTLSTFSKSVMVSLAMSMSILGTTELMFIEPGVKINGAYTVTSCSVSTFCRRVVP